jgi:hypothetical protein
MMDILQGLAFLVLLAVMGVFNYRSCLKTARTLVANSNRLSRP